VVLPQANYGHLDGNTPGDVERNSVTFGRLNAVVRNSMAQ
jgi:hypothetical protein